MDIGSDILHFDLLQLGILGAKAAYVCEVLLLGLQNALPDIFELLLCQLRCCLVALGEVVFQVLNHFPSDFGLDLLRF